MKQRCSYEWSPSRKGIGYAWGAFIGLVDAAEIDVNNLLLGNLMYDL